MSGGDVLDLTAADDALHPSPPPHDPMWTESYYFGFDLPERSLSLASYPLFRPKPGRLVAGLPPVGPTTAYLPWEVCYSRFLWHLPLAKDANLLDFEGAGLRYKTLEPLNRYLVAYRDGDRVDMELEFEGIQPPHGSWQQVDKTSQSGGKGHFDQDCRVRGALRLDGETIPIDTFGHRDRSWYVRPDTGGRRSVSIAFGINAREQFLVLSPLMVNTEALSEDGVGGYLVRDGVRVDIRRAVRRVVEHDDIRPVRIEIEATDVLGREFWATGRTVNMLAFNTSPPILAWFGQVAWNTASGDMQGENQETYAFGGYRKTLASLRA